ncbi:hypothetical protein LJY25_13065 [Hymenobacter sp. BT175]|uniref:hypothetical protein n=1 Tax=Hymenobacter translucens TaxID=2886507 RepID=UPI001D0F123D|nr:hypothetical protein [Hymenobacter translucens]MCC2547379.1 hypothetical protein [Hymenobacter translucens]
MRNATKWYLLLALLTAGLGWYGWFYFGSIRCEPCLPGSPCPPCPSTFAMAAAGMALGLEAALLAGWLTQSWRKRRGELLLQ